MVQLFKGDPVEIRMKSVADPVIDLTDSALDEFYAQGYDASPFLLAMYDDGRMPFSERIARDAFVDFVKKAFMNFPVTGTFEAYISILTEIFGPGTQIFFTVPAPGKLRIDINAISSSEFEFIGREFVGGAYEYFNIVDDLGNMLIFRGIPGIDTDYELRLLISEIMPAGITPDINLTFFNYSTFVADADGDDTLYEVIDDNGDQIVFWEIGD